ncbi:CPBP family intramembrane glutamic endopeptidase [Carnobacterium antarcticum]|uniref:CPBP family intramembrane glutamic endopeptidase n=1 Tax=Carnobacterium antarcticum TaxID=2126436 RepID=A0ABW4NN37_9LACT|nr:type II CAAX endopeptidase family protein [Carnobacterium sp. CP1]ALV22689.1 CAAX amino terminal protease family protein [Carnobacterium sp. CP1]
MKKALSHTAIVMTLVYILAQFLPVLIIVLAPQSYQTEALIYGNIFSFTAGAFVMLLLNRKSNIRNSITLSPSAPRSTVILWGILGIFMALAAQYAATLIEIFLLGLPMGSENTQQILLSIDKYPLYLIIVSIMAPIMEEFVFRKVIFGFFYDITGGVGAAVISSLLFAFMHFDSHILLYSTIGFVFSYLYVKTKNIATPIIAHVLMNTVVVLLNLFL